MRFSSPIDATVFARELLTGTHQIEGSEAASEIAGEYGRWTYAVKQWLAQTASENGCTAIYTQSRKTSEFMLDLVWWSEGRPSSAVLACESEWGNSRDPKRNAARVAEDFDKLLSFKAPFKLMIFEAARDSESERDTLAELNRYLLDYADHRVGEQYLVVNFCDNPAAWLCLIAKDGADDHLSLSPLSLL